MGEKMRIYIGGLGSNVQEDDLKKTFTSPQLGTVESVEIIRSKGRSFGYLEFLPASDKGLAKLFSSYNGCMWKGGRLKLEKAREHYMLRLQREWTEEAELETKLSSQNDVHADESGPVLQKPKTNQDFEKLQIKLFFPKLRKIKPIPLKGTGKHKYSFQRVEIPTLPIHFCDCEEHCVPPEPTKRNCTKDHEADTYGVNENELNMMKSILNKFLAKENSPNNVSNEFGLAEEETSADNRQVDESEEDQASDEDNLVINIVSQPRKRVDLFEDWEQKTTAANKDNFIRDPETSNRPIPEMRESKKGKQLLPDKKRKQQAVSENYLNDKACTKKKARKDSQVALSTQETETESHKSAWKDLVHQKEATNFHISDVLRDLNPEIEAEPISDNPAAELCLSDKDDQSSENKEMGKLSESSKKIASENDAKKDQSSQDKESEKLSDPPKQSSCEDKSIARGAAWLQKSSWLQLVADANKSAFNISQILPPGVTLGKQELPQFDCNIFSNSTSGKQNNTSSVQRDERANKDIDVLPITRDSDCVQTADNTSVGDIVVSETCPFMKNAASMKEWSKCRAALSGSLKKKENLGK